MQLGKWIFSAALVALPLPAMAQVCRGGIDFAHTRLQGQAGVEIENGSSFYTASAGLGGSRYFGRGTIGARTYEKYSGGTVLLEAEGGRVFQSRRTGSAVHCLSINGSFGTGPDNLDETGADLSSSSVTFSFGSGVPLRAGRSFLVTPFAAIAATYSSVVTTLSTASSASNDFYELFSVGLGLSVAGEYALQPYVRFPIGRDNPDPLFGMFFTLKIGDKPR